jgi:hypothetical protein
VPAPLLSSMIVALAAQSPPVVAPEWPDWNGFPVLLWTAQPGAGELARELGGVCLQRHDEGRQVREAGLAYLVFNAPGRDDLHLDRDERYRRRWQAWYDARDDALLVREPCLTDPATRERLFATLEKSLAARGGEHGLGVSLGDEVGATPGGAPEDVCLSATCRAAWTRWAAAHLGGAAPELAAISTDATRLSVADGRTEALGPWLARRAFHQDVLLDLLAELAQRSRRASPATPVGLLGIAGQSAFGGVAVERVLPLLDFVECYRVGDARELAFTLREPRQRVLLTVFCDERGPDHTAWSAWEHWLRGGDGLVAWSEADLERRPAHRERLLRAVRDIRDVQRRMGRFLPRPQGIAVAHSAAAIAASWLKDALLDGPTWPKRFPSYQEQHGPLERARKGWLELAEDLGGMPGAWPLERVGAETVERFPVSRACGPSPGPAAGWSRTRSWAGSTPPAASGPASARP